MDQPERETLGDQVVVDGHPRQVEINPRSGQFEVHVGEHVGFLTFYTKNGALALNHTEVPPALRGKGVGEVLAQAALNYARDRGLQVKPYCPFVAAFIKRHAEYRPLVHPEFSGAA